MSQSQLEAVKKFIEQKILPGVAAHGGSVDIKSIDNNVLTLTLSGSCGSCSVQSYTSEAISNFILEEFPELDDVVVQDE